MSIPSCGLGAPGSQLCTSKVAGHTWLSQVAVYVSIPAQCLLTSARKSSVSTRNAFLQYVSVPSIAAATVLQSGKTETVSVINGGSYLSPITLSPVATTLAGSQAISRVSLVSSELAGLIDFINS